MAATANRAQGLTTVSPAIRPTLPLMDLACVSRLSGLGSLPLQGVL